MLAGASQFVALPMLVSGASAFVIIATVFFVNIRHYLMAASLAPYFRATPRWARAVIAQSVSDLSYALAVARWREQAPSVAYFIGCATSINIAWIVTSALGAFFGGAVEHPERYGLDFAFPAVFIALLLPLVADRRNLAVALLSGVLAIAVAAIIPGQWYVIVAGIGGAILGALMEHRR